MPRSRTTKDRPSVFKYENYHKYLKDYLKFLGYTQGQLAEKLGYKSHRTIGMILSGKREPSYALSVKLAHFFNLDNVEQVYFLSMIFKDQVYEQAGAFPEPQNDSTEYEYAFDKMDEWYFLPIFQLISKPDFKNDEKWINSKLQNPITAAQIDWAFKVMLEIGIIYQDENGNYKTSKKLVKSEDEVTNLKVQNYHLKMFNKAKESIKKNSIEEREFRNGIINIDPKHIEQAKKELKELHTNFCNKYYNEEGQAVYSCLFGFFPV